MSLLLLLTPAPLPRGMSMRTAPRLLISSARATYRLATATDRTLPGAKDLAVVALRAHPDRNPTALTTVDTTDRLGHRFRLPHRAGQHGGEAGI